MLNARLLPFILLIVSQLVLFLVADSATAGLRRYYSGSLAQIKWQYRNRNYMQAEPIATAPIKAALKAAHGTHLSALNKEVIKYGLCHGQCCFLVKRLQQSQCGSLKLLLLALHQHGDNDWSEAYLFQEQEFLRARGQQTRVQHPMGYALELENFKELHAYLETVQEQVLILRTWTMHASIGHSLLVHMSDKKASYVFYDSMDIHGGLFAYPTRQIFLKEFFKYLRHYYHTRESNARFALEAEV